LLEKVDFYMSKAWKNRMKVELFRTALPQAGGQPEQIIEVQEKIPKEERRLR